MRLRHRSILLGLAILVVTVGVIAFATRIIPGQGSTQVYPRPWGCEPPELSTPEGAALFSKLSSVLLTREDLFGSLDEAAFAPIVQLSPQQIWRPAAPVPVPNHDVALADTRADAHGHTADESSVSDHEDQLRTSCRLLGANVTFVGAPFVGRVDMQISNEAVQFGSADKASAYLEVMAERQLNSLPLDGVVGWQQVTIPQVGDESRAFSTLLTDVPQAPSGTTGVEVQVRSGATVASVQVVSSAKTADAVGRAVSLADIVAKVVRSADLDHVSLPRDVEARENTGGDVRELLQLGDGLPQAITAAFSADGDRVVTLHADQTARVWDSQSGHLLLQLGSPTAASQVLFSADGDHILTIGDSIRLWDARTGQQVAQLTGQNSVGGIGCDFAHVCSAAFSPDGQTVLTTNALWDARTGNRLRELPEVHEVRGYAGSVLTVGFSGDGQRIATSSWDKTIRISDAQAGRRMQELHVPEDFTGVVFSPDGLRVLTRSYGLIRVWDATTGEELQETPGGSWAAFSPDGHRLLTINLAGVFVWDWKAGKQLLHIGDDRQGLSTAEFSPDGQRIITVGQDQTARIWDSATGRQLQQIGGVRSVGVARASFSPDGARLVTTGADGSAHVWDASSTR
jgi:WD40 repeat protein